MRKVPLTTIGLSLAALGSTMLVAPAQAAINCGTAPTGGTLTSSGEYCQLVFDEPGDYTANIPASANQLFAIVIGGGGDFYAPYDHYAGNAGKVTYGDLSTSITNDLTIHIGEGGDGADDAATSGTDSSVSDPSMSNYVIAFGGSMDSIPGSTCTVPGFDGRWTSAGAGARTVSNMDQNTNSCVNAEGSGVNPSLGDIDSAGNAAPSIFSDLNQTFAKGGYVAISGDGITRTRNYGDGAGYTVDPTDDVIANAGDGSHGAAILRWRYVAPLANTGFDSVGSSAIAAALMATGSALAIASRARRRVSK